MMARSTTVVARTGGPGHQGGDDLYVHVGSGDSWTAPVNLGLPVNTLANEYGPWMNADGTRLWFTSDRFGSGDVYSVVRTCGTDGRVRAQVPLPGEAANDAAPQHLLTAHEAHGYSTWGSGWNTCTRASTLASPAGPATMLNTVEDRPWCWTRRRSPAPTDSPLSGVASRWLARVQRLCAEGTP